MADDQLDEYEQGERVRTWLKNNGASLVTGIALGLACIGGWQWWQARGANHRVDAATQYAAFSDAVEAKDEARLLALSESLRKEYADTPYPALAALRAAHHLHAKGKDKEAIAALDAVGTKDLDPALAELMVLRAARLLVAQGKHDEAIKRLDSIGDPRFPGVAGEIRGDAEIARGNRDAARQAYETALTALDEAAPTRPLVEMKLTDAGGAPPAQPET